MKEKAKIIISLSLEELEDLIEEVIERKEREAREERVYGDR